MHPAVLICAGALPKLEPACAPKPRASRRGQHAFSMERRLEVQACGEEAVAAAATAERTEAAMAAANEAEERMATSDESRHNGERRKEEHTRLQPKEGEISSGHWTAVAAPPLRWLAPVAPSSVMFTSFQPSSMFASVDRWASCYDSAYRSREKSSLQFSPQLCSEV